jgi:hypothetical protein
MIGQFTPNVNPVIPAGKFIYVDETFQQKAPSFFQGEAYARQGRELIPAHFSYGHHNPDFTPVYTPATELPMNYGTYIYNIVDGYQ